MFLHEFGEDFVLALQLLFQQGDPPVLVVAGAAGAVLECGSGVLEELLLPTVEHRGVNAVLVAQIRHRGVFEEMEPKYGDLLRGAEAIPSFLGHGKTSARDCSLFERLVLPIPTEAKQLRVSDLRRYVDPSPAHRHLRLQLRRRRRTPSLSFLPIENIRRRRAGRCLTPACLFSTIHQKAKEQAGNNSPEFSQSRTKLWQGLLTLPPRRPKDGSPTRTPAGSLRSGRRRSEKTGWCHPLCGTNLSLYRIHFHRYWTAVW